MAVEGKHAIVVRNIHNPVAYGNPYDTCSHFEEKTDWQSKLTTFSCFRPLAANFNQDLDLLFFTLSDEAEFRKALNVDWSGSFGHREDSKSYVKAAIKGTRIALRS